MAKLKVIDFFCGAGGFSEGFKQLGYKIIYGYDHWRPAVDTYNHNFNLKCEPKNILDFKESVSEIEELPDTEIILGSPPCVSFSSSNKSGKADKSLGVDLTETFLRIVAVKKHKPNSILKAWFMENVVNSRKYLQQSYTFSDLGLTEWALINHKDPDSEAICLFGNSAVINSADYGSLQARKRVISGEIIDENRLIIPEITHQPKESSGSLKAYNTLKLLKNSFPSPFDKENSRAVKDILYDIEIAQHNITDHFYDTGIYEAEWKFSRYWKVNHPYMGRMSFPENENKPSRTIIATRISNSRESIIYKSEVERKGDGEYRLPTVREAAIIMGFPITYQFLGSEYTKWRLVGNAVCCAVSRSFAKVVLESLNIKISEKLFIQKDLKLDGVVNLNSFNLKRFDTPPIKKKGAKCRWHPFKDGNLTVTLSNYDIENSSHVCRKWKTSIQYGTGKGFPIQHIPDNYYKEIEPLIAKTEAGKNFIRIINNGFTDKIAPAEKFQKLFEHQEIVGNYLPPNDLVDKLAGIINEVGLDERHLLQNTEMIFFKKETVPTKQLFALYAINKIATITNHI